MTTKSKFWLIIFIILVSASLVAIGMVFGYLFMKSNIEPAPAPIAKTEEIIKQELNIGVVGEITVQDEKTGEEKPIVTPTMPTTIFSTVGEIKQTGEDFIIITSNGYSFADETAREIKALITEQTKIFSPNQADVYYGKDGLEYLYPGIKVLVGSPINIRGKIEFEVNTVNVLE